MEPANKQWLLQCALRVGGLLLTAGATVYDGKRAAWCSDEQKRGPHSLPRPSCVSGWGPDCTGACSGLGIVEARCGCWAKPGRGGQGARHTLNRLSDP